MKQLLTNRSRKLFWELFCDVWVDGNFQFFVSVYFLSFCCGKTQIFLSGEKLERWKTKQLINKCECAVYTSMSKWNAKTQLEKNNYTFSTLTITTLVLDSFLISKVLETNFIQSNRDSIKNRMMSKGQIFRLTEVLFRNTKDRRFDSS